MLKILKTLRRVSQNNCLLYCAIAQLAQDNTGTSPEGLLKVLTFETYMDHPMDYQGTDTKICGL